MMYSLLRIAWDRSQQRPLLLYRPLLLLCRLDKPAAQSFRWQDRHISQIIGSDVDWDVEGVRGAEFLLGYVTECNRRSFADRPEQENPYGRMIKHDSDAQLISGYSRRSVRPFMSRTPKDYWKEGTDQSSPVDVDLSGLNARSSGEFVRSYVMSCILLREHALSELSVRGQTEMMKLGILATSCLLDALSGVLLATFGVNGCKGNSIFWEHVANQVCLERVLSSLRKTKIHEIPQDRFVQRLAAFINTDSLQ